ncbi:hypothetical protein FRB97_005373 [Tulasnella sp. 331]|nr:hypothetical protein FRB97_005373 [Tulasnella sp. 331]KAG8868367.1 hypothetical protein FRB98_003586 [Tulasnella sp. 332]
MRWAVILTKLWTALLVFEGAAALPLEPTFHPVERATFEHNKAAVHSQSKRTWFSDLLSKKEVPGPDDSMSDLKSLSKGRIGELTDQLSRTPASSATFSSRGTLITQAWDDGWKEATFIGNGKGKVQKVYRLRSHPEHGYVLEMMRGTREGEKPSLRILTGNPPTTPAERSAAKALNRLPPNLNHATKEQLKMVKTSMGEVHKAYMTEWNESEARKEKTAKQLAK